MSSTQDSLKARIDNEITLCSICLQTFDDPRSLPCVHTFCLRCIRDYCETRPLGLTLPCPECRQEFSLPPGGVSNLPHNFIVDNLIQMSRNQEYCGEHDEEILKKVCTECCLQICSVCQVLNHSNHNCISLADAREHLVRRIDEEVEKVAATKDRITKENERLGYMTDIFCNKTKQIIEGIKSAGEERKRLIDQHVDRLISEVKTVQTETLEKLNSMTKSLKNTLRKLEQFNENVQDAKGHQRIKDFVDGFKKLSETARKYLECAESPTYQPPDISFLRNPKLASASGGLSVGELLIVRKSAVKRKHDAELLTEKMVDLKKCPVFIVLQELPEEDVVYGVAILGENLYVLRPSSKRQVEVYNSTNYTLLRRLSVPSLRGLAFDMVACERYNCLYISDQIDKYVHTVEVKGHNTRWSVGDGPSGLSVTDDHKVLVTCRASKRVKEFTKDGQLVNEIGLPASVDNPWHAIKLTNGQFAVCHGSSQRGDLFHRVCIVDRCGNIVHSYGGHRGSSPGQLDVPCRLATDKCGYIFVVDAKNHRILMLSPTLQFAGDVVTPDQLDGRPLRMCFDDRRRRLLVAANKSEDHFWTSGRIVVFRFCRQS